MATTPDPRLANATRAINDPYSLEAVTYEDMARAVLAADDAWRAEQVPSDAVTAAAQALRSECRVGFGATWSNDIAARFASAAIHAALPFLRGDAGGARWQPIETAPTDGSLILVYASPRDDLSGFITVCAYHEDAGFCVDELRYPTYWRPLPEPPVVSAALGIPTPSELAKAQSFREGYIEAEPAQWIAQLDNVEQDVESWDKWKRDAMRREVVSGIPDTPDFDRRRGALAYYARVPYDPRQTDAWREGWGLAASAGWRPGGGTGGISQTGGAQAPGLAATKGWKP